MLSKARAEGFKRLQAVKDWLQQSHDSMHSEVAAYMQQSRRVKDLNIHTQLHVRVSQPRGQVVVTLSKDFWTEDAASLEAACKALGFPFTLS